MEDGGVWGAVPGLTYYIRCVVGEITEVWRGQGQPSVSVDQKFLGGTHPSPSTSHHRGPEMPLSSTVKTMRAHRR